MAQDSLHRKMPKHLLRTLGHVEPTVRASRVEPLTPASRHLLQEPAGQRYTGEAPVFPSLPYVEVIAIPLIRAEHAGSLRCVCVSCQVVKDTSRAQRYV